MENFWDIIVWFLVASVKFVIAVTKLLVISNRAWYWDMLIVMAGGTFGVLIFTFLGAAISKKLEKYNFFKMKRSKLRKLIKIKNGYGLIGIAFITPVIISIPVGCIISSAFENVRKRLLRLQISSVLIWSLVLFVAKGLLNIQIVP
jgi:hypothetical protein